MKKLLLVLRDVALTVTFRWVLFLLGLAAIIAGGWRGGTFGWDSLAIVLDVVGVWNVALAAYMAGVFSPRLWVQDGPPDTSRLDHLDRAHRGAPNERP